METVSLTLPDGHATSQVPSGAVPPVGGWVEGLARLREMPPPIDYGGVNTQRWRQLIEDADAFLGRWGREAIELGWTSLDVFGCSKIRPFGRIDLAGLVPLLNGRRIAAMDATGAMIEVRGQRHQRFVRRYPSPAQIELWRLPL